MASPPTGFEGNLTPAQEKAFQELKQRITSSDEYADDFSREPGGDRFLLAFLRASMKDKSGERIFQVDAAQERIQNTFEFRRKYNIQEIQDWVTSGSSRTPEGYDVFLQVYPHVDCIDEENGVMIRFNRFGRWIQVVNSSLLTTEQWTRCLAYEGLYLQHQLRRLSDLKKREISTYISAGDASGLSILSVIGKSSFISFFASIAGDHFPETLGTTYLFNCPWIFPKAFAVIKPVLDRDTVSKFRMSSEIPTEEFLKLVNKDKLCQEFGGSHPTLTCDVPREVPTKKA